MTSVFRRTIWRWRRPLILRILALACFLLLAFQGVQAQSLLEVRLGAEGPRTRAVIEMEAALGYRLFYLANPPRLVIDVEGLKIEDASLSSQGRRGLIRDVRLGQFNADLSRVVLDLTQSVALADHFFLSPQGGAAYRIVIDLVAGTALENGAVLAEVPAPRVENLAENPGESLGGGDGSCRSCAGVLLPPPRPIEIAPQRYIIVLDPGHGGRDPGTISKGGLQEADLVLQMAVEIAEELRASGAYEVYLTRGTDRLVPLRERAALARGRAADFFLSIHANANPDPNFRGFMIFTLSDEASDSYAAEVAARENKSEFGAIADIEDADVGSILGDILVRDTLNQSIDFAARLVARLRQRGVYMPQTPQRRAGFAVLKSVRMPSALLEVGHLSNTREARALQNVTHRRKIAIAIRETLDAYFENN